MKNLFVLGDSISYYYGPWLERFVADTYRYDRKGRGLVTSTTRVDPEINGGDSRQVLDWLRLNPLAETDLLLLNCGLHDIRVNPQTRTYQIDARTYRENLGAVFDLLETRRLRTVWVRTTPVDDALHNAHSSKLRFERDVCAYNQIADEIVQARGIYSIDLHTFTARLESPLFRDHVHFTEAVCERQAAFIAGHLIALAESLLAQKQ